MNKDETSNPPGPVHPDLDSDSDQVPEVQLPPEMLVKILEYLDWESLIDCRLVNRQWLGISSGILCQRPEAEITFRFEHGTFSEDTTNEEKRSLSDFVTFFKGRQNCPYGRFIFCVNCSSATEFFEAKEWTDSISDAEFASRIKDLTLQFTINVQLVSFVILPEKLRDLLCKLTHLEEFDFDYDKKVTPFDFCLPLEQPKDADDNKNGHKDKEGKGEDETTPAPDLNMEKTAASGVEIQIPHLKVIKLKGFLYSQFPQLTKDVLAAAGNLQKLHLIPTWRQADIIFFPRDFHFLFSLGKLELLKEAQVYVTDEFLYELGGTVNHLTPAFKLEVLELGHCIENEHATNLTAAAHFISTLFEACKDSLRTLKMSPLGFLHSSGIRFPQFRHLRELKLNKCNFWDFSLDPFFPPGIRSMDIFPSVDSLDFELRDWRGGFPQEDCIPRFPSMKALKVAEDKFMGIGVMGFMCPNLKTLRVHKHCTHLPSLQFVQVSRSIWALMRQLESLEVDVDLSVPENNPCVIDSCFTGFSQENCYRLQGMRPTVNNDAVENGRPNLEAKLLELDPPIERAYPSILNMKDLKILRVNPYSGNERKERKVFKDKFTWISREYAFKLMPHLKLDLGEEEDPQ